MNIKRFVFLGFSYVMLCLMPIHIFAQTSLNTNMPQSVSNLAEGLLDAVVNISTSQILKGSEDSEEMTLPEAPDGSPFEEYFNDFFSKGEEENNNQSRKVESLGSGFVIDAKKGLIVTNNHVIDGADKIEVNFTDGTKLEATLLGRDAKTDLALLKVDAKAKKLTAVQFGDSETAKIGDWVMAIGNPFGLGGTVTVGIISARNRDISSGPYDNFIQTDASINRGNSGGPLFDMEGKVIGINTAIISPSGGSIGIGFAIPSDMAIAVLKQLQEFGETRRGWLAIRIQPVTKDIAEAMKLDKPRGALVSGKIKDSNVDNKQLQNGDIIIRFAGKDIKDAHSLPRIVAESPVGSVVEVTIMRDGVEKNVKVKLGRLEEKENKAETSVDIENQSYEGGVPNSEKISNLLGMNLSVLDDYTRMRFNINKDVHGVVIADVLANSLADEKRLQQGDVIVDVNQEIVKTPEDIQKRLNQLQAIGRKNVLLMVADKEGDLRFLTLALN